MSAVLLAAPDTADVGDTWRGWLLATDGDGFGTTPNSVAGVVTPPSGGAPALAATAHATLGLYELTLDLAAAGRHTVVVTVTDADNGDEVLAFTLLARATTGTLPTLQQVKDYLGETSYTDDEIADALAAETAAQARSCTIPADYPADLAQALKRRVARNLAARSVKVATFTSFAGGGGTSERVPKLDAEIERFEGPFRRWVVA